MPNAHFYEAKVIRNTEFLNTVEAAMMWCALQVWQDEDAPDSHKAIAFNMFTMPAEATRFARFFANIVIHNQVLRNQVYNESTGAVTPALMDEPALRNTILNAWDIAANPPSHLGGAG